MELQAGELQLSRFCELLWHTSGKGFWLCSECRTRLVEAASLLCKRRCGEMLRRTCLSGPWTCGMHLPKRPWAVASTAPTKSVQRHDYDENFVIHVALNLPQLKSGVCFGTHERSNLPPLPLIGEGLHKIFVLATLIYPRVLSLAASPMCCHSLCTPFS